MHKYLLFWKYKTERKRNPEKIKIIVISLRDLPVEVNTDLYFCSETKFELEHYAGGDIRNSSMKVITAFLPP